MFEFLDQCLAGVPEMMDVQTRSVRSAGLAFHPLPILRTSVVWRIDDDVFANGLGDGLLDLLAGWVIGESLVRIRDVLVGDHAALVGEGFKGEGTARHCDFGGRAPVVPAKFLDKQGLQLESLQSCLHPLSVEVGWHSQLPAFPIRPIEQMIRGS